MFPYLAIMLLAAMTIAHSAWLVAHPRAAGSPGTTLGPLVLVSTLVAGLRFQTGGDWQMYEQWYSDFSLAEIGTFGVEPGWIAYSLLLRGLGFDFDLYLLATAIVSNLLIWHGLVKVLGDRRVAAICFGFYCLIVFYSAQMFYIRSGLAAGFFLSAAAAWRSARPRALLLLLAASSFHVATALAALIYAALLMGARRRLLLVGIWLGLLALFSALSNRFLPEVYVSGEFADERALSLKAALGAVVLLVVLVRLDRFEARYSREAAILSIAGLTVPWLFESFEVGGRVRMFFSPLDGLPILFLVESAVGRRLAAAPLAVVSALFVAIYWSNPYVLELFTPYRSWLPALW